MQHCVIIVCLPVLIGIVVVLLEEGLDLVLAEWLSILAIGTTLLSGLSTDVISIEKSLCEEGVHHFEIYIIINYLIVRNRAITDLSTESTTFGDQHWGSCF